MIFVLEVSYVFTTLTPGPSAMRSLHLLLGPSPLSYPAYHNTQSQTD